MICPYCDHNDDKVIDSRASEGGRVIRRRRQCLKCSKRFTTYERVEQTSRLMVVKRDGSREPFDPEKVLKGIMAACGKRPIPEDAKHRVAEEIEDELSREFEREVPARLVGQRVMLKLRDVDEVAYIRFASEYHQFQSVGDIMDEIVTLNDRVRDVKQQQSLFREG
jgi:transcriptional repressor NrdR